VPNITNFFVDYARDRHLAFVEEARVGLFGDHKPADVIVGVTALSPGYLIEVDAYAVVDG
jgi:enamine deaminase RidA (YjgF/YER057c/UK114 family)